MSCIENEVSALDFYNQHHQNYYNKLIHAIFIPCIVLSGRILLDKFYISINDERHYLSLMKFSPGRIISNLFTIYYMTYGFKIGSVMLIYFSFVELFNYYVVTHSKFSSKRFKIAGYIFILSWIMQFMGHAIEGSRPALTESLTQAFTVAPLFSLQIFLPNLLVSS